MSATQLAQVLGMSASAVRNQENGTNGIPVAKAALYAEVLRVSPNWILFGEGGGASPRSPELSMVMEPDGRVRLEINRVVPMDAALRIVAILHEADQ